MAMDYDQAVLCAAKAAVYEMDYLGTVRGEAATEQSRRYVVCRGDVLREMDFMADEYMMFDNKA